MEQPKAEQLIATILRELIVEHFDDSELRDLCFDLGIDYQSLAGASKKDKARELVAYVKRYGRTSELVKKLRHLRPLVAWPNVEDTDPHLRPSVAWPNAEDTVPRASLPKEPLKDVVGFVLVIFILLLLFAYLYSQYAHKNEFGVSSTEVWIDQQVKVTDIYVAVPVGTNAVNLDKTLEDVFYTAFENELHAQLSDRAEIQGNLTYDGKPQRLREVSGYVVYVASVSGRVLYPQEN